MKQASIHLITGGQRSGKSAYAESLALKASTQPIYLATSKIWDEEYKKRIELHQEERSAAWTTIEEPLAIEQIEFSEKVVLLDCITLWLTNIFEVCAFDAVRAEAMALNKLNVLFQKDIELFVVSAEIGMGVIPIEAATRHFVDVHGRINQVIAKQAKNVSFMVSGLPLIVKTTNY